MAVDFSGIFARHELVEAIEREIRVPIYDPLTVRSVDPGSPQTFRYRIASPEEAAEFDRHECGEARAQDIASGSVAFRAIQERIFTEALETPAAIPIATEEVTRLIREYQDRIARAHFMDLEGLGITASSMGKSHRPDRPPPLAAPSSRLPDYRPRR